MPAAGSAESPRPGAESTGALDAFDLLSCSGRGRKKSEKNSVTKEKWSCHTGTQRVVWDLSQAGKALHRVVHAQLEVRAALVVPVVHGLRQLGERLAEFRVQSSEFILVKNGKLTRSPYPPQILAPCPCYRYTHGSVASRAPSHGK